MIKIKVPGTSANMGPGFDTLGIALNIYNTFLVKEIETGLVISGCSSRYKNENNLVIKSMRRCFDELGYKAKGIELNMNCHIPISRGLGSSAACIVGGVMAANEIAGSSLSKEDVLKIATEIEGHPDNISPAVYGGMTVSVKDGKNVYSEKINVSRSIKFCAVIPDFKLSTDKSRSVLPENIPFSDAVFNVGRVSLLIAAMQSGRSDLIKIGCRDKLHQGYRGFLINNYDEITKKCMELNSMGVFLSGAGPTIMAIIHNSNTDFKENLKLYLNTLNDKWEVKKLKIDNQGAIAVKEDKNE